MSKARRAAVFIIKAATIAFLLCVIAFSAKELLEYNKGKEEAHALAERVVTTPPQTAEATPTFPISVDFDALRAENSDVIGWLYCANTPINYPVVQSGDNNYYLRRGFDGKYLYSGTLFADYRTPGDFSGKNTLIYGHNMKNDEMFGTLVNYENPQYSAAHREMYLSTPSGNYIIQLIAGLQVQSTSEIYDGLINPDATEETVRAALEKSVFRTDTEIIGGERFITLSTCSYDSVDARFILIGTLKKA